MRLLSLEHRAGFVELRELATSLRLENGRTADRTLLIISILKRLDEEYQAFLQTGTAALTKKWTRLTDMFGKPIRLTYGNQTVDGTALRLDDQCRLVIRAQDGQERAFNSGEVTLKRETNKT